MLEIINSLNQFFSEDNYRGSSVREYAGILEMSYPAASKLLNFSRIYWKLIWKKSGFLDYF